MPNRTKYVRIGVIVTLASIFYAAPGGYQASVTNTVQPVLEAIIRGKINHTSGSQSNQVSLYISAIAAGNPLGCIVGSSASTYLGEKLGPLRTLGGVVATIYVGGSVLLGVAMKLKYLWLIIVARIIFGIGAGMNNVLTHVYVAEVSPTEKRGMFNSILKCSVAIGNLLANVLGLQAVLGTTTLIPLLFGMTGFFGLFGIMGFFFFPETPGHYVKKQDFAKADENVSRLLGKQFTKQEKNMFMHGISTSARVLKPQLTKKIPDVNTTEIVLDTTSTPHSDQNNVLLNQQVNTGDAHSDSNSSERCAGETIEAHKKATWTMNPKGIHKKANVRKDERESPTDLVDKRRLLTWAEILQNPKYRKPFLIAIILSMSMIATGQPIKNYSTEIFLRNGLSTQSAQYLTIGIYVVAEMGIFSSIGIVHKMPRRLLFMMGLGIVCAGHTVLALLPFIPNRFARITVMTAAWLITIYFQMVAISPLRVLIPLEVCQTELRIKAFGVAITNTRVVQTAAVFITYPLFTVIQSWTFLVFAGLSFALLIYTYLTIPETENKSFREISKHWEQFDILNHKKLLVAVETEKCHLTEHQTTAV